jgi:AraC family transcriptional regulator
MFSRIENIDKKKLIGKRMKMSLSNNRTSELWKSFMPVRNLIRNKINSNLISMQVYDYTPGTGIFNPGTEFDKWAAVEVASYNEIPEGMESYDLRGGPYAVFIHKGGPDTFAASFHYIFNDWLPGSDYALDRREHFEILGEKYKNDDPDSEEEIWVPIMKRISSQK